MLLDLSDLLQVSPSESLCLGAVLGMCCPAQLGGSTGEGHMRVCSLVGALDWGSPVVLDQWPSLRTGGETPLGLCLRQGQFF